MPKKIKFESFISRFLTEARKKKFQEKYENKKWSEIIEHIKFVYEDKNNIRINWLSGYITVDISKFKFHVRNDNSVTLDKEEIKNTKIHNQLKIKNIIDQIINLNK